VGDVGGGWRRRPALAAVRAGRSVGRLWSVRRNAELVNEG